jgi:hypothetical protein
MGCVKAVQPLNVDVSRQAVSATLAVRHIRDTRSLAESFVLIPELSS